eukprot:3374400-Rhodomonas_salina.4
MAAIPLFIAAVSLLMATRPLFMAAMLTRMSRGCSTRPSTSGCSPLSAYARATRCPVLTSRMLLPARPRYGHAREGTTSRTGLTRCPVLT